MASARHDEAQRNIIPQMLELDLSSSSLDFIYKQDRNIRGNKLYGTRTDRDLSGYETRLNAALEGFIYHPYFLEFNTSGGLGYISEDGRMESYQQPELNRDLKTRLDLTEYHAQLLVLKSKPYSMTLFANQSMSRFDSDFFTRITSEGQNLGVNGRYGNKVWPITWSVARSVNDSWGSSSSNRNEDLTFSLMTVNRRARGETSLTYRHQDFLREMNDIMLNQGVQQQAILSDRRQLGASGDVTLNGMVHYINQDSELNYFESLSMNESLYAVLSAAWRASSSYGYSRYEADGSVGQNHSANASLEHRLFESLSSSFTLDGTLLDSDGDKTVRLGAGITESYTKKLGKSSRLNLTYGHREGLEDSTSTGQSASTFRESVVLGDDIKFLGATGVNASTVVVRDEGETITYTQGFDYALIQVGERTQIRRLVGGLIAKGATTVVTYQATSRGNGQFGTSLDSMSFRLSLFNNHLELYGSMYDLNVREALAPLIMQGTERTLGAAVYAGPFSCGIDYTDSDLTISKYKRFTAYEALRFSPFARAQLGLNLHQSRIDYAESDSTLEILSEIVTSEVRLWRDVTLITQAGHYNEKALKEENDFITISAAISAVIAQLQVSLGHEFHDNMRNKDEDKKYYTYLRLRRTL